MPTFPSPLDLASAVLQNYGISEPCQAEFVPGGLLHRLLRVETTAGGVFALKLLSPRSTATAVSRAHLEWGEEVARRALEAGIPAMVALQGPDGSYLQNCDGQWSLLYPWLEGETLPPTAASFERCRMMGAYLARLHALKIRVPGQTRPVPEAFLKGHFRLIADRASAQKAPWEGRLWESVEELEAINEVAMQAQLQLQDGWVTGHLDCDQKNVLWQNDAPTILDWESVKPIHPALEAMGAALSWAGQSAGSPQSDAFAAFFEGYLSVCPLSPSRLDLAVDAVLGKWLIWLEFNLERLLDSEVQGTPEEEIALGAAMHALGATLKLRADGPRYQLWLKEVFQPKPRA